jgi:hypothetical protein
MHRLATLAPLAALVPVLAACTRGEPEMLRDRAVEQLTCPVDQIEVVKARERTAERTYELSGCGLRVTYRCEDSMDQVAARSTFTGSDVRSQTRCEPLSSAVAR